MDLFESATLEAPRSPNGVRTRVPTLRVFSGAGFYQPVSIFFDPQSSSCSVVIYGVPVAAPTVVYVPFNAYYADTGFDVRSTSGQVTWDPEQQLLYWQPDPSYQPTPGNHLNQVVITPGGQFDESVFPGLPTSLLPFTDFETSVPPRR